MGQTVDLRTAQSYAFAVVPEPARPVLAPEAVQATVSGPARFVVTVDPRGTTASEGSSTAALALDAPRPNPATGAATVRYTLPEGGAVRLSVVDLLGREVAVLEDGAQVASAHTVGLDASRLSAGVYVVRLVTQSGTLTQRVAIVR
jgi:Secretion system C-terminal sorting domain